jgi:hypothetical protein
MVKEDASVCKIEVNQGRKWIILMVSGWGSLSQFEKAIVLNHNGENERIVERKLARGMEHSLVIARKMTFGRWMVTLVVVVAPPLMVFWALVI